MGNRRRRTTLLVLALLLALVAAGLHGGWRQLETAMQRPIVLTAPVLFEIAPGESVTRVARALAEAGYLSHPLYLRLEASRRGLAARVQAGVYQIDPGMSPRALLQRFVRGDIKRYRYTLVEGSTFREMRRLIAALPGITHTLAQASDTELMEAIGAADLSPEGRFFPSTYFYVHRTADTELYARAFREMQQVLETAWAARKPDLPYRTPEDALVMASIIEKETAVPAERARIAGVFVRRLQVGMRLQTDPSVIYGMGETYSGNLTRADLARDTPWNTYTRTGLPPTPIALPGRAAIDAALNPAADDALYFVARGDGSHVFSASLKAHNLAVRRYQRP